MLKRVLTILCMFICIIFMNNMYVQATGVVTGAPPNASIDGVGDGLVCVKANGPLSTRGVDVYALPDWSSSPGGRTIYFSNILS